MGDIPRRKSPSLELNTGQVEPAVSQLSEEDLRLPDDGGIPKFLLRKFDPKKDRA